MRISKNEKGVTLLIVLLLTAVALIISAGLLYMVLQSTHMSGSMKRYKTVYEAATGGVEVACELINVGANPNIPGIHNFTIPNNNRLFSPTQGKLIVPTAQWGGWNTAINIDTADPDVSFTLGANDEYKVYIKIIDAVGSMAGVARGSGTGLHTSGVVQNAGSSVTSVNTPRLYTVEVLAENTNNVMERARVSLLYQY